MAYTTWLARSARDGGLQDCADYLAAMFRGMGDEVTVTETVDGVDIFQSGLRVIRGLPDGEADIVFHCWAEIWKGTARSQRMMKNLSVERDGLVARWRLQPLIDESVHD